MKLAVIFPGIGYHCDKPLLYYARKLVVEYGYDQVISLVYTYDGGNIKGNEEEMKKAFVALYEQATEQLSGISFHEYEEIVFVSKSIGTVIASMYAKEHELCCKQILYTPLAQTFDVDHQDAIAFIGSKDPWSDVDRVVAMASSQSVPMKVYENANHSLETLDTMNNIQILKDVMDETLEFIK